MKNQFARTMYEVGQVNPKLVVVVGDLCHWAMQPFAKACPGRYYNTGVTEAATIGLGAGLSAVGLIPVVHLIAPFMVERSFEFIKLDFSYNEFPGNLVSAGSSFDYSFLGATHHTYTDYATLKTLPKTQLIYPAAPQEFDLLFRQTYNNDFLTYFRLPQTEHGVSIDKNKIKVGTGIKIKDGEDITIVATGSQLKSAVESAETLKKMDYDPEIIYIHTLKPLDTKLITSSAEKTKKIITMEEHSIIGGLYADVLEAVKEIPGVKVSPIAIPADFLRGYGGYEDHCKALGLTAEGIVKKVKTDFRRKK
ncbi:TPA: hypothetical protein H1016_01505 [archaeon]|uniref:Transketolase-like pyrimidine-binding domain-containing protein n=1 Tax=Candidatus Naiadarchaeum limnaeum TaxID=2756139 RepID=A0A832UN06_9ARCH|nr:hypothetical protein [Candidatus Naiadarchaeum limnaeum]